MILAGNNILKVSYFYKYVCVWFISNWHRKMELFKSIRTHVYIQRGDNPGEVVHVSVGTVHGSKPREDSHQSHPYHSYATENIIRKQTTV